MLRFAASGRSPWHLLLRSKPVLLILAGLILLLTVWDLSALPQDSAWSGLLNHPLGGSRLEKPDPERANSTLGFQTILAVSGENTSDIGAWRQRGLRAAAERTGLQIQIQQQNTVTAQQLNDFRGNGETQPSEGSAMAWMAHVQTLQYIIDHKISTALILEDDADWDINIKTQLAPDAPIPSAFRLLYGASNSDLLTRPFGTSFDVLWLGHCGASLLNDSVEVLVEDDTLQPLDMVRALWGLAYENLGENHRQVFSHAHASCSYAYAVTLEGAHRVMQAITKGGAAFDNVLADNCKADSINCASVGPELFHQMRRVGDTSLIDAITNGLKGEKVEHHEGERARFFTHNIKYSARCNAGHAADELVQCLPTNEEFDQYVS